MKLYVILTILSLILMYSCAYNIEEVLYPEDDCEILEPRYSKIITSILSENCYVCHSESANVAGINFESHAKLKPFVDNGSFIGTITHSPNFTAMPQGAGQLDKCLIETIQAWIDDGAPNN